MTLPAFTEPPVGSLFDEEEIEAVRGVLASGESLNRGKDVDAFEKEFAEYCGAAHAVAVSSCTAALRLAIQVLRLGRGDEVVVQANVFWASMAPLMERGAAIKIVDVDGYSLTADPASVEKQITPQTKAILVLSMGGNPCRMDELRRIADAHGIPIVEDAAHAVGTSYRGKKIGAWADITCFSFSTLKNMGTLGEGGMFVTNNKEWAAEVAKLREYWPIGRSHAVQREGFGPYRKPVDSSFMRPGDSYAVDWDELQEMGTNYKMSSPAAAVGRVQLKKLDKHNAIRRSIATRYDTALRGLQGVALLKQYPTAQPSWHLYNFFLLQESGIDRDAFVAHMNDAHNIQLINRFWPIHLHSVLRMQGHAISEAPVYERIWFRELVALPIAPSMDDGIVERVISAVESTYRSLSGKAS
ncbi:MAG: glutamine--scyllo-inositol transaminase [Candidatus Peregrinibacteria bacterium Greene0416_19]|nr:MAG: glutamine--scyllo-inositol transaminase [Candidatus Peregrinibacteria bacterium Greene0416_19]